MRTVFLVECTSCGTLFAQNNLPSPSRGVRVADEPIPVPFTKALAARPVLRTHRRMGCTAQIAAFQAVTLAEILHPERT